MDYQVYLRQEALEFLQGRKHHERQRLLQLCKELGVDPYRSGDYREPDDTGRPIEVLIHQQYAVLFWADHPVQEVKVVDIRLADR